MMFTDADSNEDTKSASLQTDAADGFYRLEYNETRDTDGLPATDCDTALDLTVAKEEEPQDVCYTLCPEKNGTGSVSDNFDKHKYIVVIFTWNVVKVMQNQTSTTNVHCTYFTL